MGPQLSGTLRAFAIILLLSAQAFRLSASPEAPESQITSRLSAGGVLGSPFQYQISADNEPHSFDASNLPPGLSVDRSTGLISGVPTISGDYRIKLVAHGANGDVEAICSVRVYLAVPAPDSPFAALQVSCLDLLADPSRPRIYCSTMNGVAVIDTETMTVLTTVSQGVISDFSFSGDGQTLWLFRIPGPPQKPITKVNLDTLEVVEVPTAGPVYAFRAGLANRLYVAGSHNEIVQIDATTGAVEQRFQPSEGFRPYPAYAKIEISHDGKTLYVGDSHYLDDTLVTHASLSRYDVSTAIPQLLQRVDVPAPYIPYITVAPDGASVYMTPGSFVSGGDWFTHQTLCLAADDLTVTKGAFSYRGTPGGPIAITPDGRTALQTVELSNGGILTTGLVQVFDAENFQPTRTIVLGTTHGSISFYSIAMTGAAMDQSGSYIFAGASLELQPSSAPTLFVYSTALPAPPATPDKSLLNLSTRLLTQNGDNVLIGGFIVTGNEPKKVILRAIGSSLPLPGKLTDPVLELHGADGSLITVNDNWNSHRPDVIATGIPPADEHEAAIVAILEPGAYTAIVRGNRDASGIAVFELYDLNTSSNSRFANISTRGKVEIADEVMIGGFIIGGNKSTNIAIRAIGPSLATSGVSGELADPELAVHDGNGALVAQADDWRILQEKELIDAGLAPTDERESALLLSLQSGAYTAIVRGKGESTGVALVEVYNLDVN